MAGYFLYAGGPFYGWRGNYARGAEYVWGAARGVAGFGAAVGGGVTGAAGALTGSERLREAGRDMVGYAHKQLGSPKSPEDVQGVEAQLPHFIRKTKDLAEEYLRIHRAQEEIARKQKANSDRCINQIKKIKKHVEPLNEIERTQSAGQHLPAIKQEIIELEDMLNTRSELEQKQIQISEELTELLKKIQ